MSNFLVCQGYCSFIEFLREDEDRQENPEVHERRS